MLRGRGVKGEGVGAFGVVCIPVPTLLAGGGVGYGVAHPNIAPLWGVGVVVVGGWGWGVLALVNGEAAMKWGSCCDRIFSATTVYPC